jgi:hypothetical protein
MDTEEHFLVTTPRYKFNVTISTRDYRVYKQYTVFVGGKSKGCVVITLGSPPTNSRYASMVSNAAQIPSCSVDKLLERGEGTKYMMKLALRLIKDNVFAAYGYEFSCESERTFELTDRSSFPCGDYSISLAHVSVALYGQTWYEKHFGAKLKDDSMRERYNDAVGAMSKQEHKRPFIEFMGLYGYSVAKEHLKVFESLYTKADTYQAFFRALREDASLSSDYCTILQGFVSDFVNGEMGGVNLLNQTWTIQNVPSIDMTRVLVSKLDKPPAYTHHAAGGRVGRVKDAGVSIDTL